MKNVTKIALPFFLVLLSSQVSLARVQGGKLDSLRRYAGTGEVAAVFNNPLVRTQLLRLLGRERRTLDAYLDVKGTINLVDDNLVIEGCAPHACNVRSAIVIIELFNGVVHAAIADVESTSVRVFSAQKTYSYLPRRLQEWVFLRGASCARNLEYAERPPAGVVFR